MAGEILNTFLSNILPMIVGNAKENKARKRKDSRAIDLREKIDDPNKLDLQKKQAKNYSVEPTVAQKAKIGVQTGKDRRDIKEAAKLKEGFSPLRTKVKKATEIRRESIKSKDSPEKTRVAVKKGLELAGLQPERKKTNPRTIKQRVVARIAAKDSAKDTIKEQGKKFGEGVKTERKDRIMKLVGPQQDEAKAIKDAPEWKRKESEAEKRYKFMMSKIESSNSRDNLLYFTDNTLRKQYLDNKRIINNLKNETGPDAEARMAKAKAANKKISENTQDVFTGSQFIQNQVAEDGSFKSWIKKEQILNKNQKLYISAAKYEP